MVDLQQQLSAFRALFPGQVIMAVGLGGCGDIPYNIYGIGSYFGFKILLPGFSFGSMG